MAIPPPLPPSCHYGRVVTLPPSVSSLSLSRSFSALRNAFYADTILGNSDDASTLNEKGDDFCADLIKWTALLMSTDSTPLVNSVSYE